MATNQISDALLVKNYIAGDENALAILINRHQSKIYNFIYSKISDRDVADDIFQDTFIKVIKTLKSNAYNETGKFLPWVMRISHNLVIDHFRKGQKMPMLRDSEEFSVFSMITEVTQPLETYIGAHIGHDEITDVLPERTGFEVFDFDSQVFHSFLKEFPVNSEQTCGDVPVEQQITAFKEFDSRLLKAMIQKHARWMI